MGKSMSQPYCHFQKQKQNNIFFLMMLEIILFCWHKNKLVLG